MITVFKKVKEAIKSKWPGLKEKGGKVFGEIPELFFVGGPGGSLHPTLLTILLIIIPMMIFKDKIVSGVRYLMDLIGK